ncbi:MAG: YlxR family protein [Thermomicrobiales bacterium]|jgi:predicted RNA-binding protein YlxR (DUF448 family)|nr:YlxR family protein [Thermomicrobiales bacterium]MCC6943584.1 YlxR family protein [Thermomicrobiales bacterium]
MAEPAASSSAKPRGKRKGPRPKHTPQRTCIACRDKTAKRTLIRIVRTPEGDVQVDPTGRANGRGAYLCDDPACWQRALKSTALEHALKVTLDAGAKERLRDFANQNLSVPGDDAQSEGVTTT